jgi:hypothetical protein
MMGKQAPAITMREAALMVSVLVLMAASTLSLLIRETVILRHIWWGLP